MISAAEDLFAELNRAGAAWVDQAIANAVQENDFLEYKVIKSSTGKLVSDDRTPLAKAISGFANADGGVLLLGVDCRRKQDGSTERLSPQPLERLEDMRVAVYSALSSLVQPKIDGTRCEALPIAADRGYLAIFVPRVDYGPVMAKSGGHCYYMRSGDSTHPMSHTEVELHFGKRPRAILDLSSYCLKKGSNAQGEYYLVEIRVRNAGRGIGRDFAMIVKSGFELDNASGVEGCRPIRLAPEAGDEGRFMYALDSGRTILPSTSVPVCRVYVPEICRGFEIDAILVADGVVREGQWHIDVPALVDRFLEGPPQ